MLSRKGMFPLLATALLLGSTKPTTAERVLFTRGRKPDEDASDRGIGGCSPDYYVYDDAVIPSLVRGGFLAGNYQNRCCHCQALFMGHKHAVSCEKCAASFTSATELVVRPANEDFNERRVLIEVLPQNVVFVDGGYPTGHETKRRMAELVALGGLGHIVRVALDREDFLELTPPPVHLLTPKIAPELAEYPSNLGRYQLGRSRWQQKAGMHAKQLGQRRRKNKAAKQARRKQRK